MKTLKALACAMACAGVMTVETLPAAAQPMASIAAPASTAAMATAPSAIDRVQSRNGGRHYGGNRGFRRGGRGGGIGLGIGAAIIGGIVLSEAARAEHRTSHGDEWNRCEQTYRSFEADTGMYTGYDGVRRTCSYLQ